MATAAAASLVRERQIAEAFVRVGVTSPGLAVAPEEIAVDSHAAPGWG